MQSFKDDVPSIGAMQLIDAMCSHALRCVHFDA